MAGDEPATDPSLRRRLAAILAADCVDYSRLMADDEAATLLALDAARAQFRHGITSHGGRVVDMAGDSVLALFDAATAAVGAALAIQRALALTGQDGDGNGVGHNSGQFNDGREAMTFRIGVHLGEVIEKGDGTVYGEGVNTAARLEGLAEAGRVVVSDAVYASVRGRLVARFDDLGRHRVKNLAAPLQAWRASEEVRAMPADGGSSGGPSAGLAGGGLTGRRAPGAAAGPQRLATQRVLPPLLVEISFALLPLLVLGASWPGDAAPSRSSFAASPAWPMTACVLYGLSLARLLAAMRREGLPRGRPQGSAAALVALLPLAGVVASTVLIVRLNLQVAGSGTLAASFVNLALALLCFAVFGGYGLRGDTTPGSGGTR